MHVVKSRGQLEILRQNADLTPFVTEGDFIGRQLGNGSVEEVRSLNLISMPSPPNSPFLL